MLPAYEDTKPKTGKLAELTLKKQEAAEYLSIEPGDVWALVRQGHLTPVIGDKGDENKGDKKEKRFSIMELDRTAAWYDVFRHQRRTVALVLLGIGVALICLSLVGIYFFSDEYYRLLWIGFHVGFTFGAGLWGLALRSHRLERQMLSAPMPDYGVTYPTIVFVNSSLTLLGLHGR